MRRGVEKGKGNGVFLRPKKAVVNLLPACSYNFQALGHLASSVQASQGFIRCPIPRKRKRSR